MPEAVDIVRDALAGTYAVEREIGSGGMADLDQQGTGRDRGWRKPLRSFAARIRNDDILTGFQRDEASAPEIRTFFVSTIGAGLVAWDVAFNFGAFHTVFFARRHQVAVVLFVVVLGTIVLRRQVKVNWWLLGILSIPMFWILFRLAFPVRDANSTASRVDGILFILVVMLYPMVLWIVLRLVAPDYFSIPNRRLKVMSVVIVIVIALVGYAIGEQNSRFLSCNEFKVSGNDLPADCADGG